MRPYLHQNNSQMHISPFPSFKSYLHVGTSGREENVVGMPVEGEDGTADRLLDMLTNPPIVILLKVADANTARSRSDRKLVLLRRPANKSRSTVNTQENQSGLPLMRSTVEGPDIGVSVLGAGDDTVGLGGPVDRGYGLVVLGQG